MTIAEWLDKTTKQIDRLDAELLLLNFLGQNDRSFLVAHNEDELEDTSNLDRLVARRANGEPLAYILGKREFYGRNFHVTPSVLIPRPETEDIIDIVKHVNPPSILDIGTGSGCIAITLDLELPDAEVFATDISEDALEVAKENALQRGAHVNFFHSDLLIDYRPKPDTLIIANLPYVDKNWIWLDHKTLDNEPSLALYAEQGGLALIYKLIDQYPNNAIGLVLEADPSQHKAIIEYASQRGLEHQLTRNFIIYLK